MPLILTVPDIALFSDPEGTRVEIPHLRGQRRTRRFDQTVVLFEGDDFPTAFRGVGRSRTYDLECVYTASEHLAMRQLLDLLEDAHDAVDGRLQLRTNAGQVEGLDPVAVVTVAEVPEEPLGGLGWRVTFTATVVQHTVEV